MSSNVLFDTSVLSNLSSAQCHDPYVQCVLPRSSRADTRCDQVAGLSALVYDHILTVRLGRLPIILRRCSRVCSSATR